MQHNILEISLCPIMSVCYVVSPFPGTTDERSRIDGPVRYDSGTIILAYCIPLCQVTQPFPNSSQRVLQHPISRCSSVTWEHTCWAWPFCVCKRSTALNNYLKSVAYWFIANGVYYLPVMFLRPRHSRRNTRSPTQPDPSLSALQVTMSFPGMCVAQIQNGEFFVARHCSLHHQSVSLCGWERSATHWMWKYRPLP